MGGKYLTVLFLVVIVGLALRLVALTFNPPALNWDEVSHGYNAYSILKTGKDEWGVSFPLTNIRAYGDYPLPLNLYLTIPFISTLGLNEFSIRSPHVILGILTILSTYFLVLGILGKKGPALFASFLVATHPWYVFTSRFVLQSNLSVFFLTGGMAFFFNRKTNKWFLPLSFLFLGLTLYSYHSTRIFTPLLFAVLLILYRKEVLSSLTDMKVKIATILIFVTFFVPLPFILASPEARARSASVFLIDEGAISEIIEARRKLEVPSGIARLIYNRPTYFLFNFSKNYLEYFSPNFLFLKGGTQYQFSVPNTGLLYLASLPLFYIGLIVLARKAFGGNTSFRLILGWLVLSPIPAAITKEHFAVVRATPMLPLPEILITLGAIATISYLNKHKGIFLKKLVISIYFVLFVFGFASYLVRYFTSYREDYSWAWQYGYKEAVNYAKGSYDLYDKVIVTKKYGEPHEFFLFFWPWDPQKYMEDPALIRYPQSGWFWVDRFDKFYFVNDWQVKDQVLESGGEINCTNKKCLLITSPGNYPDGWEKIETINFLDGKVAFEIYEN